MCGAGPGRGRTGGERRCTSEEGDGGGDKEDPRRQATVVALRRPVVGSWEHGQPPGTTSSRWASLDRATLCPTSPAAHPPFGRHRREPRGALWLPVGVPVQAGRSCSVGLFPLSPAEVPPYLGTPTMASTSRHQYRFKAASPASVRRGTPDEGRTVKLNVWNGLLPSLSRLSALT